jgi:hypothetical protein
MEWWAKDENEIATLKSDDFGVETLIAIELDGKFIYAITSWWYKNPTLKIMFSDGKIREGAHDVSR